MAAGRSGCTCRRQQAGAGEGRKTVLLSSVCGNVALRLREYMEKMPQLRIVFSVMTLNGATNNLQFNQDYGSATRAFEGGSAASGNE